MATQKPRSKEQRRARRKAQEPVMTMRRWRAARKRIWEDMTGCTCMRVIVVNGKTEVLGRNEMCTRAAIRCKGRAARWERDVAKLGPEPGAENVEAAK